MITLLDKTFNPTWIQGASFKELFLAYTLHSGKSENVKNKFFNRITFYAFFVLCFTGYLTNGWFFNYYTGSPTLSKIFASHPNLPFSLKTVKAIVSFAMSEILYVHLYSLLLYFKRREQFEKIFRLEYFMDQSFKRILLKFTEIVSLMNSLFGMANGCIFYLYGMDATDFTGKVITIIWVILVMPHTRSVACLLFLLYSYIILIAQMVKQCSSNTVAFCQKLIPVSRTLNDRFVMSLKVRYIFIVTTINRTQELISTITTIGSLLSIPVMALAWLLLFDQPETLFLHSLKWFFFPVVAIFASRIYIFNIYFSRIHSESKKLHFTLNSLIARGKVRNDGNKSLFFIIENISGQRNQMAYHDSIGTLVEQMDVVRSIFRTLELLMLGLAFRNKALSS